MLSEIHASEIVNIVRILQERGLDGMIGWNGATR